jgi:hypothetical protein
MHMHTYKIIAVGFGLAWLFMVLSFYIGGGRWFAVRWFLPLWFVVTLVNLWGGTRAGYSVTEELPIQLLVFAIPACASVAMGRFLLR